MAFFGFLPPKLRELRCVIEAQQNKGRPHGAILNAHRGSNSPETIEPWGAACAFTYKYFLPLSRVM